MSLTYEEREALIKYRIDNAYQALDDAEYNAKDKRWHITANRLYYAIFYAASALLISEGIGFHTHKGLITQIGYYYVKAGKLTKQEGHLIGELFSLNEADYLITDKTNRKETQPWLPK